MNQVCKYCKGTKFLAMSFEEKEVAGRRVLYPSALPCFCDIHKQMLGKFPIFSRFPIVPPEDAIKSHARYESSKNIIFLGDIELFLYATKSFFTKGFIRKDYMILEGMNIVDRYNVPRPDGTRLTVEALNMYDLLVILFTSHLEYQSLKGCVTEVVKNRFLINKSTWIYSQGQQELEGSKEYSKDLKEYLSEYKTVNINNETPFLGYDKQVSARLNIDNAAKLQDKLGGF